MRAANALFLLLCVLRGTVAFVPSSRSPRAPALSSLQMTKLNDERSISAKKYPWRKRLVSIIPSWLRPTENKKKRRAVASLLVAASFAFSQPVKALSSKGEVVTCTKQRQASSGIFCQTASQEKSTSIQRNPKLAVIPVSSKKEGFWTKRKVIMLAAGGGTVLGLSLVPPVKDEDETDEKTPSAYELQSPLPSSITKEAFRELEELFGVDENAKTVENIDPQKTVTLRPPSIEEDVRVISDPSAEKVESSPKVETVKPKGIKAVKKLTPIVEDMDTPLLRDEIQDNKLEEIVDFVGQAKVADIEEQVSSQADLAAISKKEEATRKAILEERLKQTLEKKQEQPNVDLAIEKNKNGMPKADVIENDANVRNTAQLAALSKKEEATRRAILEERLKEEARLLKFREEENSQRTLSEERSKEEDRLLKVKKEEVSRRALLEERLKQEALKAESKKQEQERNEKKEEVASMSTYEEEVELDEKLEEIVSDPVSKDEAFSDKPRIEKASEDMPSTVGQKIGYRRQPLSPDEEDKLQKKYSALPLKERAYRILVDLGMIDSSPE